MKICYVSSGVLHDKVFFDKFQQKKVDVDVIVLGQSRIENAEGLTVHYLLSGFARRLLKRFPRAMRYPVFAVEAVKDFFYLKKLLRKTKPDLLQGTHVQSMGFLCALTGYRPFLLAPFGSDVLVNPQQKKLYRIIARYTLKRADTILCNSESMKQAVLKLIDYPADDIVAFPWGIYHDQFNPEVDGSEIRKRLGWGDNKIIIMTRFFTWVYGIEYFLESIPAIVKAEPDARIIMCGDGPLGNKFKNYVKRAGLTDYVHFAGRVPNTELPQYLAAADIYVSSSLSDGTSIALIEAMACGLPVVMTDVASNLEWVIDGVNGFIVPRRDNRIIAEKIIELLGNEKLRKSFGAENIRIARERGNWDKNYEKAEVIYRKLIDKAL